MAFRHTVFITYNAKRPVDTRTSANPQQKSTSNPSRIREQDCRYSKSPRYRLPGHRFPGCFQALHLALEPAQVPVQVPVQAQVLLLVQAQVPVPTQVLLLEPPLLQLSGSFSSSGARP